MDRVVPPFTPPTVDSSACDPSFRPNRRGGEQLASILLPADRFPIDDFQARFDAMRSGQSGKVVLDWGGR